MSTQQRLILLLACMFLAIGCQLVIPTPPPGWRSPVSDLLVEDAAFPESWFVLAPEETKTDPTINHVGRRWGEMTGAHAEQAIWRAYTIAEAREKYEELRQSQFQSTGFKPPSEIAFRSQVADEFYLACGWDIWAYCEVVALYRNYVVDIRMDHQAELNGMVSPGLTDQEIETVVRAMDNKFAEALDSLPTPLPE